MFIDAKSEYDAGCLALDKHEYAEAAQAFTRAIRVDSENPLYLCGAALAKLRIGQFGKSEALYLKAVKATKKSFGKDHPHVASVTFGLIDLYWNQGRYLEVEELCQGLLDSLKAGPFTSARARITHRLAEIYRQQGLFEKAESIYLDALQECEAVFGSNHPKLATILPHLADLYRIMGRKTAAANVLQRSISLNGPSKVNEMHPINFAGPQMPAKQGSGKAA